MALKPEVKLKPYQTVGVRYMLQHNYVLNADMQGLGKTIQTIAVQQASDTKALIVCPATVKYNWAEEYKKFTDEKNVRVGLRPAKINIVNYEQLYKCSELFREAELVCFDEAHYIKNMEAQRTKYAHRMIGKYKPERMIMLSGTPIKNRVPDFYAILKLLGETPIPNNGRNINDKFKTQTKFNDYFCNRKSFNVRVKGRGGKYFNKKIVKYEGLTKEAELKAYLKHKYIRRLARNVLDLHEPIFKPVYVSYKEDLALEEEWNKFCSGLGSTLNSKSKAESARKTAPFTADYIKDLLANGERPIVVFSDHIEPLNIIAAKLPRAKAAFITGQITNMKTRQASINAFQKGELDLILCTYGAAATGINLTRAWNLVQNDESWDESANSQAVKRIDRIGQVRVPIIHQVFGSPTSMRISKDLKGKQETIGKIVKR